MKAYYSREEKQRIYFNAEIKRPSSSNIISINDPRWRDLNGPLLVQKTNQLDDGKIPATVLAASQVEFNYLCQPIKNIKTLEERKFMIEELFVVFDKLDPLITNLVELEQVFTRLLESQHNSAAYSTISQLCFQGSVVAVGTCCTIPYVMNHLLFDWQSFMASQYNIFWLFSMVGLKIAGTASGFYKSCEFVWDTAQQVRAKLSKDDRFILDFAQAMQNVERIIEIVKENPTLANTLTMFIDFDNSRVIHPLLNNIIKRAKKRLSINDYNLYALWSSKNSSSLYHEIMLFTEQFKYLYYALARLDGYLAIVRIYKDREERGLPVTLVNYNHSSERPYFRFKNLKNPLIDNSVENDFELNGHAVLNGPSTCGKTAVLKEISSAFMMGQSLLLVFANEAEIAPVGNIGAYFNVGDNIQVGHSSLKAQILAMENLLKLDESTEKERSLLLIDEPLKGATSDIGEELVATKLMEKIVLLPHVTALISTHFESPTEYANNFNYIHNWHPELLEQDGKFVRTFKIKEGVLPWWFKDKEKARKFINQIYDETR